MEVDAFLADSVVSAEGKLYVQGGGWNVVYAPVLPFRFARIGVGMIIRIPYTATNQAHQFEIFLRDADGNELPLGEAPPGVETEDGKIRRIGGEFNVGRPPTLEAGDEQLVALALNLDSLQFDSANRYEVVIMLDGTEVKNLGFRLVAMQQMAPIVR
jgi:hypothetical protein